MKRIDITGLTDEEIAARITPEMSDEGQRTITRLRKVLDSLIADTGQTAHSSMLKPCPFCGGRAYVQYWDYPSGRGYTYYGGIEARVVCGNCHVSTRRDYEDNTTYIPTGEDITKALVIEKAINMWNQRAEIDND